MATLREIRGRISGVKSTQKITKAMKMVAAAKLRRAQDAIIAARPYARILREMLGNISRVASPQAHPFMTPREVRRAVVVVVTGDRGLCGAFNSNVLRAATDHIDRTYASLADVPGAVRLVVVGKKGVDHFARRSRDMAARYPGVFAGLQFHTAQTIAGQLTGWYLDGSVDRVDIIYNEFKNVAQQRIMVDQFLPIPSLEAAEPVRSAEVEYIFEPSGPELLDKLLPKHLTFQVWRVLLESNAAEQGARMTAMNNATENARELISLLTLSYNKARQSGITKELLEIVSGAEALRKAG